MFRPAQGPIELDTLELTQVQPALWQSGPVGPHHTIGGAYQVNFYVQPVGEGLQATESFPIPIEQYTDFLVDSLAIAQPHLRAGDHSYFDLPVTHRRYIRQRPIASVDVRLAGLSDSMIIHGPDTTYVVVDSFTTDTTVQIPAEVTSLTEVLIPVTLRPRAYRFTVTLDPDHRVVETNETNNVTPLFVTLPQIYSASNALGTYYLRPLEPHAFHVHYAVGDTLWLRATPESLPGNTAAFAYSGPVSLTTSEQIRLASQSLFPPIANRAVRVFHVMLGDSTEALAGGSANVEAVMNLSHVPPASLGQISVFQKRRESPNWRRLDATRFDTLSADSLRINDTLVVVVGYTVRVHGTSRGLGDFALFRSEDLVGPIVDFSADGMHFTRGSILPRRPTVYAMLTDVNGIDRSPSHFFAVLDNDTIPNSEISWNDTLQSGGGMSALLRPQLEPGAHALRVIATDNIGNVTPADITFEVRGEFGIEWAINYPNPFSKTTRISYVLTDVTDRPVEVKIYTVAGRRIRTLRELDPTVVNYRTFDWDGKDETGDEVANGVYFAHPWTDKNVYWLSWGDGQPGLRMGQMTVGWHPEWPNDQIRTLTSVKNKVHAEQDLKHDRLAQAAEEQRATLEVSGPLGVHDDHWFWGSRIDGLTTRSFGISLPFPNTRSFRSVKVRAALQGFSYSPYGGHRAIVFLDGLTAPGLAVGKVSANDTNHVDWRNQTPIDGWAKHRLGTRCRETGRRAPTTRCMPTGSRLNTIARCAPRGGSSVRFRHDP